MKFETDILILRPGDVDLSFSPLRKDIDVETFVLDVRDPLTAAPQIDGVEIKLRDEVTLEASLPKQKSPCHSSH